MARFVKAAESRQVRERFGYAVTIENHKIALFRHQGRVYALRDSCPHQGAPINQGYINEGCVVCPHHGWMFRVENGAFSNNENLKIRVYPVKEEDGDIFVMVD